MKECKIATEDEKWRRRSSRNSNYKGFDDLVEWGVTHEKSCKYTHKRTVHTLAYLKWLLSW